MDAIQLLVIDLGSQYSLVIGRTLRELGYRSIILSPQRAEKWLSQSKPKGVILSGGSASVYWEYAPEPPRSILEKNVPILGICYGMQWLTHVLGGEVVAHREHKGYGKALVHFGTGDKLFSGLGEEGTVWESHGDSVGKLPPGFRETAKKVSDSSIAGMSYPEEKIWGLQFHPEVTHTEQGKKILQNFAKSICECEKDWKPQDVISGIRDEVVQAAQGRRAIIGFSGGVDSSTLSAILVPVLGKNLQAVCINTGALRKNELQEIRENAYAARVQLRVVQAAKRFQKVLGDSTHSEVKRRRFKKLYGRILEEAARDRDFGADFIVQGSLATDIIESGSVGNSALIKSHHNIGLNLKIKELHPFRNLFKYEVRALAHELGLPESISERQPFPGPGLFVRVVGKPPRPDKLAIVRWADAEVTRIFREHGIYNEISQLVVALNCNRTVGVKGDGRLYGYSIWVRGVVTADFMTAVGYQIPDEVRAEISSAVTKHPKIVAVDFRETNKPPATTEFE